MKIFFIQSDLMGVHLNKYLRAKGLTRISSLSPTGDYVVIREGIPPKEILKRIVTFSKMDPVPMIIIPHFLNQTIEIVGLIEGLVEATIINYLVIVNNHLESAEEVRYFEEDDESNFLEIADLIQSHK